MQTIFQHIALRAKQSLIYVGRVQATILMGIVYYTIIGPMVILYQLFHRQKPSSKTYWVKKAAITDMDFYLRKQF